MTHRYESVPTRTYQAGPVKTRANTTDWDNAPDWSLLTGKEVMASLLHFESPRVDGPFLALVAMSVGQEDNRNLFIAALTRLTAPFAQRT